MNRSIRLLAGGFLLSAATILAACGSSDPAPSQSDGVTTTTEAMTDEGGSMTSTTEAMSEEGKDGSMSDGDKGDAMDDGTDQG
jgi:ABC-type glycerol-3-phosphate transport system substrate-binding protein